MAKSIRKKPSKSKSKKTAVDQPNIASVQSPDKTQDKTKFTQAGAIRPSQLKKLLRRHWKKIVIALILLAAGAFFYLRSQAVEEPLTFIQPQRQDLVKTLDVSGVVDAKEKARLRFIAGGKVTYIGAQEGDWVKKWQTLAIIDQATLEKQLEKDLNLYLQERYDWENRQDDLSTRTLPKEELRTVNQEQLDLDNTVLDVEIRDIAIDNTVLSAPFAGILTTSPTSTAGVQLISTDYFEIINPDTFIFLAEVDESDIAQVQLDQAATIELDAYPDEPLVTSVAKIAYTSSETSSGTVFLVELPLRIASQSATLRLGMNGDVAITLAKKSDVLTIPLIATREREGKIFVDVQTGPESYEEREITTGLETDENIEVLSGLTESDSILLPE